MQLNPIPVAARSKAWACGRRLTGDCGFESRRGHGSYLLWVCADSGLCHEMFTCLEESYHLCLSNCVCPQNHSNEDAQYGCKANKNEGYYCHIINNNDSCD